MMIDVSLKKTQGQFTLNVSFTSGGSGTTGLFGHSGAGKTSMINMISGLSRPDAGHIIINGNTVFDSRKKINLPTEKRRFGYVFQEGRLFPHLSVRSNLVYGMKRVPKRKRFIDMEQVIDLLGIRHLLTRRPATLSGGEKQRAAIGRALLSSPVMLLMDEPLASLDTARKKEVLPFIKRLSSHLSIPILYVSHAMDEIINLADTLVLLSDGEVTACGPASNIVCQKETGLFPRQEQIGAMFNTQVMGHDRQTQITKLSFGGGELKIPMAELAEGETVRIWIRSGDVGLSTEPFRHTSFSNVFAGKVTSLNFETTDGLVDVQTDIGVPITATIKREAFKTLNLHSGMKIYTVIKRISTGFAK